MKKFFFNFCIICVCCFCFSACTSTDTNSSKEKLPNKEITSSKENASDKEKTSDKEKVSGKEITLYANFSSGNANAIDLNLIKSKKVTVDKITATTIANKLSKWSGLDFTLNKATVSKGILTVDWSENSTLIANLDEREQKKDFHFYDTDSMRWFMMDSFYQSCIENMNITKVYYTMNNGKELSFQQLYPISVFPKEVPYMGSAFYFAHADGQGEEKNNVEDSSLYKPTAGVWRIDGLKSTDYIKMDGLGAFTYFYANGSVESNGYITYIKNIGEYKMYSKDNVFLNVFYISDKGELIMGRDNGTIFKKD